MNPYIGMIFPFGGNFAISGFAMCNGQLLAIATNTAVFSILGTFYGGNGINNFALPDLRGRTLLHQGQGPGLSSYSIAQNGGAETEILNVSQLPSHSHEFSVNNAPGNTATPGTSTYLAAGAATGSGPNASQLNSYTTSGYNTSLAPNTVGLSGGSQPISLIQPYLAVTYLIALQGVFPSRN